MKNPQPLGTCAILINVDNQVLLGKRKNSYKSGFYGLPGGRTEVNEAIYALVDVVKSEHALINELLI